ncbi:tetratricopeptide repeat protein [Elusimicrobiota bacterium]
MIDDKVMYFRNQIIFIFFLSTVYCLLSTSANAYWGHPDEEFLERGKFSYVESALSAENDPELLGLLKFYRGDYEGAWRVLSSSGIFKDPVSRLCPKGDDKCLMGISKRSSLKKYIRKRSFVKYLAHMKSISWKFAKRFESEHFVFKLASRDMVLKDGAIKALEACVAEVGEWIRYVPGEKILVEVYRNKKDFAFATTLGDELLEKSGVVGVAKFHRLMLMSPESLAFGYSWQDTFCHEYIHQALKAKAGMRLPLWFQEGVARHGEAIWRRGMFKMSPGDEEELMLAARENRLVTFNRMEPSMVYLKDTKEISLAFTQVALAIDRMLSLAGEFKREQSMRELLIGIDNGMGFKSAFKDIYRKSWRKFEKKLFKEWKTSAKNVEELEYTGAFRSLVQFKESAHDEIIFLGPRAAHIIKLGDDMMTRGKYFSALELYRTALSNGSSNPFILSRMVKAYRSAKKRNDARSIAEKLLKQNPNWPPSYETMGNIYHDMAKFKDAVRMYEKYFTFNPYHKDLYIKTADMLVDLGRTKDAIAYLEKALILDPNNRKARELKKSLK